MFSAPRSAPHSDPLLGFAPELFEARRARVLDALGSDAMVLPAAPRLYRAGDSELPYRPDSELFYLSGFTEPDAVLVLRGFASEARVVLFIPPRDPAQEQWDGVRLGPDRARELLGVGDVRSNREVEGGLSELLKGADRVHYRLNPGPGASARGASFQGMVEGEVLGALRVARHRGARTGVGPRGILDPGGILDELRLRKDPAEIEALREAARATVAGFERAFECVARRVAGRAAGAGSGGGLGGGSGPAVGLGEWDLEAELLRGFRRAGGSGPAFAPIVAGGIRGSILHYAANDQPLAPTDLVLLDAGAEVRLYAGDISRTIPVGGRFSPEQRALYEVVLAARDAGIAAARAGTPVSAVHEAASRALARGLVDLGVLPSGADGEGFEAGAHRTFFPHQTSHWLGLNTHDPGDYVRDGAPRLLEPGMVLTVEPGLYLPSEGLFGGGEVPDPDPASRFRGMGIRIEDDVLITEGDPEVLTGALPVTVEALEARLSSGSGRR
jgi:Xaa-Pro aminopeptidase